MQATVVALVVVSAFFHLGWNLVIRGRSGSLLFVWWLTLFGGLVATALTLILRIPLQFGQVWPWLAGTIAFHALYFLGLSRSYKDGALAEVYSATRGGGVLGTTLLAGLLFHQRLPLLTLIGVVAVSLLIIVPALRGRQKPGVILWAALVALTIAVYSTVDSHGVRLLSPIPYIACQFLGVAAILAPWAWRDHSPVDKRLAVGAGMMSVVSYLLILYAYQRASAAPVVALRQIGIAVSPLAGWLLLKERVRRYTWWVSLGIALGSVLIVLG